MCHAHLFVFTALTFTYGGSGFTTSYPLWGFIWPHFPGRFSAGPERASRIGVPPLPVRAAGPLFAASCGDHRERTPTFAKGPRPFSLPYSQPSIRHQAPSQGRSPGRRPETVGRCARKRCRQIYSWVLIVRRHSLQVIRPALKGVPLTVGTRRPRGRTRVCSCVPDFCSGRADHSAKGAKLGRSRSER